MADQTILDALHAVAEGLQTQNSVLNELRADVDTLKAKRTGERKSPTTKAVAEAPEPVRLLLENPDAELVALESAVSAKRPSKASMVRRAAAHSTEALQTYICAGGKAARAFMAGQAEAITNPTPMGLIPNSATHLYANAWVNRLSGITPKPAGKRGGRVTGNSASQATKRAAKAGGKL